MKPAVTSPPPNMFKLIVAVKMRYSAAQDQAIVAYLASSTPVSFHFSSSTTVDKKKKDTAE